MVFSVIVIEELFSKVIDPKVVDYSLLFFYYIYGCKLTKCQVCLHVIPTASNCKRCTDNDPKVIDNSLFYYFSITSIAANLNNIRFVCMLFQLLVTVNNVQTMAEPFFKQHEKTTHTLCSNVLTSDLQMVYKCVFSC